MQDFLSLLFTQDNITLALSIFGSVGTVITFISSYLTKRKRLKIKINSAVHNGILQKLILNISFENHSQLPIAITSIKGKLDDSELPLVSYPYYVGHADFSDKGVVVERKFTYNLNLPLDISQLSAASGHILFEFVLADSQKISTPLTLLIYSTRGKVQKIQLQPDQIVYL